VREGFHGQVPVIEVEAAGFEAPRQTAATEMDHDDAVEKSQRDWMTMPATGAIGRTMPAVMPTAALWRRRQAVSVR
jgi:hypothetical protein